MQKVSKSKIKQAVALLVDSYQPLGIYLFGSYAWGSPDAESDVDFLVVLDDSTLLNLSSQIKGKQVLKNLNIATDIILNHHHFFEERAEHPSTLQYKIKSEGKLMYDNLSRMAIQSEA